jgi:hypothetical protein
LSAEKIKLLDACQRAGKQPHKGSSACIVQNEIFAIHVTEIAQQKSYMTRALLAHIAWYFNARYGFPEEHADRKFEVESFPELERLFEMLHRSHTLHSYIFEHLQQQREMKEWVKTKGEEGFKREVVGVMLTLQEPLMNALESTVSSLQHSVPIP